MMTILPLFAVLGLLYALSTHSLQLREFNWSVEQEAGAIGSSIHHFVAQDFGRYFQEDGEDGWRPTDQLDRVFRRMALQPALLEIRVVDAAGSMLYGGPEAKPSDSAGDAQRASRFEELREGEAPYRHELDLEAARPHLDIYTYLPVPGDPPGGLVVHVRRDASSFALLHRELIRDTVLETLLILAAGVVVTLLLTGLIRRETGRLYDRCEACLAGEDRDTQSDNLILELNDLGETLQMLVGVLDQQVDRHRKSVIENEQIRSPGHIASTLRELTHPPFEGDCRGRYLRLGASGSPAPEHIAVRLEGEDRTVIFLGATGGGEPLETALRTDSLSRLLKGGKGVDPEWPDLGTLGRWTGIDIAWMDRVGVQDDGRVTVDRWEGDHWHRFANYEADDPGAIVIARFTPEDEPAISRYRGLADRMALPATQLFDDLRILSDPRRSVPMAVLGPRQPEQEAKRRPGHVL